MRRPDFRDRLRSASRRQLYSFFSSLGTLLSHPLGTLMTVLVLGIAMALPLGLYVTLENLQRVDLRQENWGAITVFLGAGVGADEARALTEQINGRADAAATAISPEEGLEEFRDASGFGPALDVLERNPLPWVIEVQPQAASGQELAEVVGQLTGWLGSLGPVEAVLVDSKWLQRLAGILGLGRALVTVLIVLFSIAVLVVVANTIRLDVANRADEIEVLSLVGAGNGFIRLPFLYSGLWYGLLGAGLAMLLTYLGIAYVASPLEALLDAYASRFELYAPGVGDGLSVLAGGGILGVSGAWISVQRYLRALRRGASLARL